MSSNIRDQKIKELDILREKGLEPYPHKFDRKQNTRNILEAFGSMDSGEIRENEQIKTAGRVMAIRDHGKSAFFEISDFYGSVQGYIRKSEVGQDAFDMFKEHISTGDFVGIEGFPFKSKTGELSVYTKKIQLLTKALRPMPEKWHGLKDKEVIYRQRYVDLIANKDSMQRFKTRFEVIRLIREFMHKNGFVEVETPMLHYTLGGASARPFVTHMNTYDIDMYMRIAPELYLKRLIVGGFDRVFEINKNFRNEGVSYKHSPEFTMMEFYQSYADYYDLMKLTEELFGYVVNALFGQYEIEYQGQKIDFKPPWSKVTMQGFIKDHLGADILNDSDEMLLQILKKHHNEPQIKDRSHLIDGLWDLVEDLIIQPTFVMDHPVVISPLAKKHRADPRVTERFEPIIMGREMGNAFTELNDPIDQRERFEKQVAMRDSGDEEAQMMDHDFIRALEYGLPPTGGEGIGIDRLVMFLTNAASIRDVIPFPMVKPSSLEEEYSEETEQDEMR
ncbi:MAG TPA: lysine--tRNA ligase [Thermotogota bacterium]|nr:lysine--tRNA ligase [Thermotogota bacterium]HRW33885.1 lysine--tRNA ligase [Thermotogota bacterium]